MTDEAEKCKDQDYRITPSSVIGIATINSMADVYFFFNLDNIRHLGDKNYKSGFPNSEVMHAYVRSDKDNIIAAEKHQRQDQDVSAMLAIGTFFVVNVATAFAIKKSGIVGQAIDSVKNVFNKKEQSAKLG